MFKEAYEAGYDHALEKVAIIGIRLKTLTESDNKKHSVGLNFPGIIDYAYDGKPGEGTRLTGGVSLIGPQVGLRTDGKKKKES